MSKKYIGEHNPLVPRAKGQNSDADLVIEYIRHKVKLGECEDSEKGRKNLEACLRKLPVEFLKSEVDILQRRLAGGGEINPLVPKAEKAQ
jgi:hypothetical protein